MKQQNIRKPFSTKKITVNEIDHIEFGNFGFKDEHNRIVIEAQYTSCGDFSCGLCPVAYQSWYHMPDGKRLYEMHWGYIDENGKERIPFRFRDARSFNQYGVAAVCDEYDTEYYLIDIRGRKVFGGKDIDVSHLYNPEERYLEYRKGGFLFDEYVGAYDTKRKKVLLEPNTGGISAEPDGAILVYEHGPVCPADFRMHYINEDGEELYPGLVGKGFSIVERPDERGYAVVAFFDFTETKDGKAGCPAPDGRSFYRSIRYGVADPDGKLVIPAEYDGIRKLENGSFECFNGASKEAVYPKAGRV